MINLKIILRIFKLIFYIYVFIHFYLKCRVNAERALDHKGLHPEITITLGIIFEKDSEEVQKAFKTAMTIYNSKKTPIEFKIYVDIINTADVFKLSRIICNQYTRGAVALLGSVQSDSFDIIRSYTNTFKMPFITPWLPEKVQLPPIDGINYAVSLRPDYHQAIIDIIVHYGWTNIIYIYDSHDGLLRLQSIYNKLTPGNTLFRISHVRRISKAIEVIDFLVQLESIDRWSKKYVVLDSSTEIAKETVIKHARNFKLGRRTYHYLLSGLVMDDYWSESTHEFETLNITGFRVLDYSSKNMKDFLELWHSRTHISPKAAMMFDSLNFMIEAMFRLWREKPEFLPAAASRTIPVNATIPDCDLHKEVKPFEYGAMLAKIIKTTEIDGLTGSITFDDDGHRSNFTLRVVEMTTSSKPELIGTWYDNSGLSTPQDVGWVRPPDRNKIYIITTIEDNPYIMPVVNYNSKKKKYKGFCIDLAKMIMDILELKYEIRLVRDGTYGSETPEYDGGWDGIVGELIRKEADLSISSLSLTAHREEVIEFSRTFLSFETKPEEVPVAPDSIFSFLQPLSMEIWYCVIGSFVAVSLCLFIVSKYSPNEYQLRLRTKGNTRFTRAKPPQATVENTFTLWNAIWFALGSFMQQSSGYTPRSVSGRIVSGVWWFVAMFIIIIYTANLTTHLTISQLNPPMYPDNTVTKCPLETNKPCEMLISVMETGLKDFAVAFPKGSPLREGVNMALQKLRDDGELFRLIRRWFMPLSCTDKNHGKELNLSHIAGLFYILLAGLGLGLITGFIEYLVYRRCNRDRPLDISPPGTPIRRIPSSPMMRSIKAHPHSALGEPESIDWNAANYAEFGSTSVEQYQEPPMMHGTFRQV